MKKCYKGLKLKITLLDSEDVITGSFLTEEGAGEKDESWFGGGDAQVPEGQLL